MKTIDVIVPLYNQLILETPVVSQFLGSAGITFYICDNSTSAEIKQENQREERKYQDIRYVDMNGNKGISAAYNTAIELCNGDIVCIFDDDTTPAVDYFDLVREQVNGDGIYLPIVKSGEKILSPLNCFGPMIYPVADVSEVNLETCSAFNTGMVYTKKVSSLIRYDESLFLEFVDHDFCRRSHDLKIDFKMMTDAVLEQDYSVSTNSLEAALHRDQLGQKDVRYYYSRNLIDKIYCTLYLSYRALRNSLRYRTVRFFHNVTK